VGTKSKYQVKVHPDVRTEDIPSLPTQLQNDFSGYQLAIARDPYQKRGVSNHALKGKLKGYWALEIDWEGVAYRLVYRVYEKPSPRRVLVVSFAEHDPAYEKAIARVQN